MAARSPSRIQQERHERRRRAPSEGARAEGAREREFYKFYEPFRHVMEALSHSDDTPDPPERSKPCSSPDKGLAAFAQLGALRLNARRVLVSFFDRKRQYVFAEATRSLSLHNDVTSHPDDALWLGSCILKRPGTLCDCTFGYGRNKKTVDDAVKVITDPEKYRDEFPLFPDNFRFYAGVPIITQDGYTIGAYSIFDDKPREGLDDDERNFLKDISQTIMLHLDMVRSKDEHRRSGRMVLGLGNFIEGKVSLHDWHHGDIGDDQGDQGENSNEQNVTSLEATGQSKYNPAEDESTDRPGDVVARREGTASLERHPPLGKSITEDTSRDVLADPGLAARITGTPTPDKSAVSAKHSSKGSVGDLQAQVLSTNVKSSFSRAANLILQAIDVQGALFLDASVGTFGTLVKEVSSKDGSSEDEETSDESQEKKCPLLGYAIATGEPLGGKPFDMPIKDFTMTERFLHSLLKEHPKGQILNFDDTDEQPLVENPLKENREEDREDWAQQMTPPEPPLHNDAEARARRKKRRREMRVLRRAFPGVRSMCFLPIWDSHRNRWFAGGFVWSTSPIRLLHMDSELSFLTAFAHSIMAEVARLDTAMADKAKADLLSSISHELRSPLHGILGSVECLEDAEMDSFQESLVHSIETCGRTLLDTIDHLLDFAKINNLSQGANKRKASARRRSLANDPAGFPAPAAGMINLDVDVDLSAITEEVVETVVSGYDGFTSSSSTKDNNFSAWERENPDAAHQLDPARSVTAGLGSRKVAVIVDIAQNKTPGWVMRTQAGAWRRIVLNLCGNSLKYTEHGFVHVKLACEPVDSTRHKESSRISLIVTDSGKGISKDYLANQLFTPFQQEDPLAPGTGLGLSIVRQIVNDMGGDITVNSEVGRGSVIRVDVVMFHSNPSSPMRKHSVTGSIVEKSHTIKGAFLGMDGDVENLEGLSSSLQTGRSTDNTRKLFLASMYRAFRSWFGMDMQLIENIDDAHGLELVIMAEDSIPSLKQKLAELDNQQKEQKSSDIPTGLVIFVLCRSVSTARHHIAETGRSLHSNKLVFIPQPFGPRKLARALAMSFDKQSSQQSEEQSDLPMEQDINSAGVAGADQPTVDQPPDASTTTVLSQPPDTKDIEPTLKSTTQQSPPHSKTWPPQQRPAASERTMSNTTDGSFGERPMSSAGTVPGRLHVLIVDDNKINLQLLMKYLKKKNYSFDTAEDGLEALEAYTNAHSEKEPVPDGNMEKDCRQDQADGIEALSETTTQTQDFANDEPPKSPTSTTSPASVPAPASQSQPSTRPTSATPSSTSTSQKYDFVLMDISMPRMDGLEATRRIRSFERSSGLKSTTIIALTGLASANAQQEAFGSGVDLFLTKPVRLGELNTILERAVREKREREGSGSSTL